MNTDFLKNYSKAELYCYCSCALYNLFEATCCAEDEKEYYQMMSEVTSDLKVYLNVLSVMLRYMGVSCSGLQDKTEFDMKNEEFFESILDRLGERNSTEREKVSPEFREQAYKCDLSKFG